MTIVVHQHDTAVFDRNIAVVLETTIDTLEALEGGNESIVCDLQFARNRDRGERIPHVVEARKLQVDFERLFAIFPMHVEAGHGTCIGDVRGRNVGVALDAVGHDRPSNVGKDCIDAGVVSADHREAVEWQVVQELDEALAQFLDVAFVRGHVIDIDVRNNRQHRLQAHEGCIALVGFRHQVVTQSEARIGIHTFQAATDDKSRIEVTLCENAGHEASRRRFAVRTGDRDGITEAHQLSEHLGTGHNRQLGGPRGDHFGVAFVDGAGDHHGIGFLNIARVVTDEDSCTQSAEAFDLAIATEVRALHLVAEVQHDLGDS